MKKSRLKCVNFWIISDKTIGVAFVQLCVCKKKETEKYFLSHLFFVFVFVFYLIKMV